MQLRLNRSQRSKGMMSKAVIFCLDARADLTPDELQNVRKYGLGSQLLYSPAATMKHLEKAREAFQRDTFGGVVRGWTSLAMAKFQIEITIDSLTKGHHIECKDLDELLAAQEAIIEGCKMMKSYLEVAATFDGSEQVIDFDQPELAAA
jgi:hypothetical protein